MTKRFPRTGSGETPSSASSRSTASATVILSSSLVAMFGSSSSALPQSAQLMTSSDSNVIGTWRALSWHQSRGPTGADCYFFFALCSIASITQLDGARSRLIPADGAAAASFPDVGRIELDFVAMVDCLREAPHMAADVFDFLQDTAADYPDGGRARDLAVSLLHATARRDGFIEIAGRPECDGLLIQGWSFALAQGGRCAYLERDGLVRCEAVVGSFARSDLPEEAQGIVAFFKDVKGDAARDVDRIYVRTPAGYSHLDMVDKPVLLQGADAVQHIRQMLPQLAGDATELRALKRVTRPRFEGEDTSSTLEAPVRLAVDRMLHVDGTGILVSGWMLDPRRLVRMALLKSTGNFYARISESWHRMPRPDVSEGFRTDSTLAPFLPCDDPHGFVVFVPQAKPLEPGESFYVELVLEDETCVFLPVALSGHDIDATARQLLGSVNVDDPAFDAVVARHLGPAIAAAMAERPLVELALPKIPLGAPHIAPRVSIVLPIEDDGGDLDVNLAQLAGDLDFDSVEFIFVASRAINDGLPRRLERYVEFYGLHGYLAVPAAPTAYFEALDLGARVAQADLLLFLSQSTYPREAGWLSALMSELKRQPFAAAISPTLLYEDHSIRYAGAVANPEPSSESAALFNLVGYPDHWLSGNEVTATESVAPECCLIRRNAYFAAKGFSREFFGADYGAVDLSRRLGRAGLTCLWLPEVTMYALDPEGHSESLEYWTKPARRVDAWRFASKWADAAVAIEDERAAP